MKFYATIRIELPCKPTEKAAIAMAQRAADDMYITNNAINGYLCHVTKQDGLEVTEVLNNID